MCTLAIYFRVSRAFPLIVAANRDEFLNRAAADPGLISDNPWVVGGRDLVAGGTWLGLNERHMVVGLLNRMRLGGPDPTRRSRGLLCLEALQAGSPEAVLELLGDRPPEAYNGFNLLFADAERAYVATNHLDRLSLEPLSPGVHLLTNLDLNDPTCPRIARSHELFRDLALPNDASEFPAFVGRLRTILADHVTPLDPRGETAGNTLCIHRGEYGTRSSTIIARLENERRSFYWHAAGPPCRAEYQPIRLP
jgi:uncharacterized protein with NRDE domain